MMKRRPTTNDQRFTILRAALRLTKCRAECCECVHCLSFCRVCLSVWLSVSVCGCTQADPLFKTRKADAARCIYLKHLSRISWVKRMHLALNAWRLRVFSLWHVMYVCGCCCCIGIREIGQGRRRSHGMPTATATATATVTGRRRTWATGHPREQFAVLSIETHTGTAQEYILRVCLA